MFNLHEMLENLGHSTEVSGLHPTLQANWSEARSFLDDVCNSGTPLAAIGCEPGFIRDAFFASRTRDAEWYETKGYVPMVQYLTPRVDLYEVPGPLLISIASETTAKVATVLVVFNDVDPAGYGDWDSVDCYVHRIHEDSDAAAECFKNLNRAIRTMRAVISGIDRVRSDTYLRDTKVAPAF